MSTHSAAGLAILHSSFDPQLDNRPSPSSAQPASVCRQLPAGTQYIPPDSAIPRVHPAISAVHQPSPSHTGNPLGHRPAYPTPRTTQGELDCLTPSEAYRTPHDLPSSCPTTSLYLSPMVNLRTPTSTHNGEFATPETTPAISYYESTRSTPNLHQTPHTTVEGSSFSPSLYRTPFDLVSIGAIDHRPSAVMNQITPVSSFDKDSHRSLRLRTNSEVSLEQDFHTPDGSPPSPYQTPHDGSPELPLGFQPPAGYLASAMSGHPLSFLSLSPSEASQGAPTMHDAPTPDSTFPSTTSSKEGWSPTLEISQGARRFRHQRPHATPLKRSHSSISLTNPGSSPEGSSLRAREMMELAQALQKAREITEDFAHSSPKEESPLEDWGLVRGNTFGSLSLPSGKYGRHIPISRGSLFHPGHRRFSSSSTTSTTFFDVEENDDTGNHDGTRPSRRSLSITTAWPGRAATPPPLLSPFKEKSDGPGRDGDLLMTPNIKMEEPAVRSTPLTNLLVLHGVADQTPPKRTQSQSGTSSSVKTSSHTPSSPLREELRVQDAPSIVVEHLEPGHNLLTEKLELLVEENRTSSSTGDAQVLRRLTTNHGFAEGSTSALGLSPSIYLPPLHEVQLSSNSLDPVRIIKPEIQRGLSTPSFMSGVLQAGLSLEELEREITASSEEDMEAVHFQVLTAVVGTREQASSSTSLSHYSTEGSPKHPQPHLSSLISSGTTYVTTTDLSTAARSSPALLHNSTLQSPPDPSSTIVSEPTNFVLSLTEGCEVDREVQLLKLPSTVDTTERGESVPIGSLSSCDPKPQPKPPNDPLVLKRKSGTDIEEKSKPETQAVTLPRVRRASNRLADQLSENRPSSPKRSSTLRPLSPSGNASVSPVSPSSVIGRASARLTNPFSFLHPSPLSSPSSYASGVSPGRPVKPPEQPSSNKQSRTGTPPGDMKQALSARQRLSKLLRGLEFGKAGSPTIPDRANVELVVGPDVFGAGEGKESWIRTSREGATNYEGPASSETNVGREAAVAVQKEKSKKKGTSVRPTSMIWLGSNKVKPPVAVRGEEKSTKAPWASLPSIQPPPRNDPINWSMLNASATSAVGNNDGLRIINLPPPHAVEATVDVPSSRKSQSRRKSMAVSREESGNEVEQANKRRRSSFLGALMRK